MLKCSFCGKESEAVIRVVLDKDYDRLTIKHDVKYACPECSKKKEEEKISRTKKG
jgi:DNA-directed RNA polymerase subunit RPC12/RpoP